MKDYALDKNGDIVLFNNDIEWKTGAPLTAQTIQHRLGANTGEWFLDKDYGIDFGVILRKKQNIEQVKSEILRALREVDDSYYFTSFVSDVEGRAQTIRFTAANSRGETVEINRTWE